jgi:alpha-1,2-mannosyltransferase
MPAIVYAVAALGSLYGWALAASTISHPGSIGLDLDAPGGDWTVFYGAVRAFFSGNLGLIFDGDRFTAHLNSTFSWWLPNPIPFRPWVYPPTYLLVLLPFGALPFVASYLTFQFVSAAILAGTLCFATGRSTPKALIACFALASPAASFNIVGGQNAFLIAALLIVGLGLLRGRPLVGGALLGVLTLKPQFWILVPVVLIAAREWKALIASVAAAAVLIGISAAVFGVDAWQRWLDFAIGSFASGNAKWVEYGRMWGDSVYACVVAGAGSQILANSAQAAAIVFAACATYRAFRLPLPFDYKIAVALAGTILAAPHSSLPDALLLAIAALLWISQSSADRASIWRWLLALCLWLIPFLNPPLVSPIGRLTPFVVIAFLGVVIAGGKNNRATQEQVLS